MATSVQPGYVPSTSFQTETPFEDNFDLSIVVPVFNEEENLILLYQKLAPVLDSLKLKVEVVFVDDGSSDRSPEIIQKLVWNYCEIMPKVF